MAEHWDLWSTELKNLKKYYLHSMVFRIVSKVYEIGLPGSRLFHPNEEVSKELNIRVITIDRQVFLNLN